MITIPWSRCSVCSHRVKFPIITASELTIYYTRTKRTVPAGSKVCGNCHPSLVPAEQLHLFINQPTSRGKNETRKV
jgi:hypothetical protein